MNQLYRIGQIDIGMSVRFHAVVHEVWSIESAVTRDRRLASWLIRESAQIIETSLRWASVSPSMYR